MNVRRILAGLMTLAAVITGAVAVAPSAHAERTCTTHGICLYDDGAEGPYFQTERNDFVRLDPDDEDNRADWARHRKSVAVRYIVITPNFWSYLCVPASRHTAVNLANWNILGLEGNSFANSVDAVNAQSGPRCDGEDRITRGIIQR